MWLDSANSTVKSQWQESLESVTVLSGIKGVLFRGYRCLHLLNLFTRLTLEQKKTIRLLAKSIVMKTSFSWKTIVHYHYLALIKMVETVIGASSEVWLPATVFPTPAATVEWCSP